jgi:DNA polymerase III subunit alpha
MFINLHTHSRHSHDSVSNISDMVKYVKENGQTALAITDHGNMSGFPVLFQECQKAGIKSIGGNELYVCQSGMLATQKDNDNRRLDHLVVLAKNETGYRNLLKLTSIANLPEHYYYKPRIDKEILQAYSEGLIVINGHVGTSLSHIFFNEDGVRISNSVDEAMNYLQPDFEEYVKEEAGWFRDVFGDDFYVECQLFDKEDVYQQTLGWTLYNTAKKLGFQTVGTGDSHYIRPEDQIVHKTFVAIKQNTKIVRMDPCRYLDSGMYGLITNEWAEDCYPEDLIQTTNDIADKIEEYDIRRKFSIPQFWDNPDKLLRDICEEQLGKKVPDTPEYRNRVDHELKTLALGNVESYFLLVKDYIDFAESQNILTGCSRGSSGGSLVSYLCNITKIDPLEYNLLFSRFISEDRLAAGQLPDIDSDFAASKRDIILDYIKNKYGHENVAELITHGTLQGRGALKDVLRVYNACDFTTMNNITNLFPKRDQVSDKLAEFKEDYGTDSLIIYSLVTDAKAFSDYCHYDINTGEFTGEYAKYFEIAVKLEGAIKSEAKHPCAVIISDKPISDSAPLFKDKNGNLLCAYDAAPAELVGLVKYDILGISALDKLQTLNTILAEHGIK